MAVRVWTRNKAGTQRLAPCLVALFEQADARWPNRPWQSDGTIGDAAHSARTSDHNPGDDTTDPDPTLWVCAADLTDAAPNPPVARLFCEHLRTTRDPRVKYCISEGEAWYAYAKGTRPAFAWVPYTGVNAHKQHGHVSVFNTAAARNDLRPWFPPQEGDSNATPMEDDLNDAEKKLLFGILEHLKNEIDSAEILHDLGRLDNIQNTLAASHAQVLAAVGADRAQLAVIDDVALAAIADAVNDELARRQRD